MKPNEPSSNQSGDPLLSQGSLSSATENQTGQDAAARLIRSQIDNIYSNEQASPYERTHAEHVQPQAEQWRQYHTAWQNYYQQYYEGYYTHHLNQAKKTLENQIASTKPIQNETESTDELIFDLRQKLIGKVKKSATKVRKSRHFIPITAGVAVVLILLFMQFNRFLISNVVAYISPGNIDPQNIIVNPSSVISVSPEPKLIIPKINVDVPVLYDVGSDYNSQMTAMTKGVAHFAITGANSHPGEIGNTVIAGHSSNDLLDSGDYKFIFAQLDKLVAGDTVYLNYNSVRYSYTVTKKIVVKPSDVSSLVYPTDKPILTLLTCTPLGTSLNRLLVTAEQVSPDPSKSAAAPTTTGTQSSSIPGSSPTLFERIFGKN